MIAWLPLDEPQPAVAADGFFAAYTAAECEHRAEYEDEFPELDEEYVNDHWHN